MNRYKDTVPRRFSVLFSLVITSYIFLISSYFLHSIIPPWVKYINWVKGYQNSVIILFALEFTTLTFVSATFLVIELTPSKRRKQRLLKLNSIELKSLVIFSVITIFYAIIKIVSGDNPIVRLLYAGFSALLLTFWFCNAYFLLQWAMKSFKRIFSALDQHPEYIFSSGREITYVVNAVSWSITILILPLFSWAPTLLTVGISPRTVSLILGCLICLSAIFTPIYAQRIVSKALNQSFQELDKHIACEILRPPTVKEDIEKLKTSLELRENLTNSVKLPNSEIVVIILQYSAIITALIAIFKL